MSTLEEEDDERRGMMSSSSDSDDDDGQQNDDEDSSELLYEDYVRLERTASDDEGIIIDSNNPRSVGNSSSSGSGIRQRQRHRHRSSGDIIRRLKENANVHTETIRKTGTAVKRRWRKVVTGSRDKRIRDWAKEAKVVKTVDKFSFVTGVLMLCITEFMVLRFPQYFGMYYVGLVSYLLLLRLYMYAKNKWLYFLIDFCYLVNASCFVSVLLLPHNQQLWRLNYAVSNGTLLGAVLAWRNSLVFHSLDKVTSLAIHVMPALLTYLERWSTTMDSVNSNNNSTSTMCQSSNNDNCTIGIMGSIVEPLLLYVLWQILYIIKTEILDRNRMLADPTIQTSMRWLTRDKKNAMHKTAKKVCRVLGILRPTEEFNPESLKTKFAFWIGQLLFIFITLIPIPFVFTNYWLNTGYILLVLSMAVYNGSNYYFEVFAGRYLQQLEDRATATATTTSTTSTTTKTTSSTTTAAAGSPQSNNNKDDDDEKEGERTSAVAVANKKKNGIATATTKKQD